MSGWARVGVQCVCVDDAGAHDDPDLVGPVKRGIYTIRLVLDLGRHGGLSLLLEETRNGKYLLTNGTHGEPAWRLRRFRPLVPLKTQTDDIALIKSLLNSPEHERA